MIDFICDNLAPSGTFWGVWYRDKGWRAELVAGAGRAALAHARRGDAVPAPARWNWTRRCGRSKPAWVAALRSNLDAVVARQRADGNLGSLHHAVTGEVLSWEGAAGLAWVNGAGRVGTVGRRRRGTSPRPSVPGE